MEHSTTDRSATQLSLPAEGEVDRLPWPFAVLTIAALAGSLWALVGLVVSRLT